MERGFSEGCARRIACENGAQTANKRKEVAMLQALNPDEGDNAPLHFLDAKFRAYFL
eukprot:IDg20283t1